ncbi:MAG TPA: radical SAM protein [Methanobacterium subterraneum]|uniref:Radical SAM protein n=1 Tax=Methanobacterium subterraneum TaxID=59277 RepID=A0A7J4TIG5_9EURY|nr:radical SAM protein [Methanobacterium subterraneum]
MKDLAKCQLCPWNCKANRLEGEMGVCHSGLPEVAYTGLTPVLKTFAVTLLACSFRCIYCNAYRISQYPDSGWIYRGYVPPDKLVSEVMNAFTTSFAQKIGVKKLSFTGGEPSINTPYLEEIVKMLGEDLPDLEVGVATNGFCTHSTMQRLEKFSNYLNFEIKAFNNELHQAITGAPVENVLENAEWLGRNHPEKIRVFRTVVIPGINDSEIPQIARFLHDIDPNLPYRLVGFRPHFMLYYHPAPSRDYMQKLVRECRDMGLENVDYSGYYPGGNLIMDSSLKNGLKNSNRILNQAGCYRSPRICGDCPENGSCPAIVLEPWTNLPQE